MGVEPQDISESQALMMITSSLPAGVSVEDLAVDEQATPAKLIITAKYEEEAEEPIASANKESPPAKPKKKRKRSTQSHAQARISSTLPPHQKIQRWDEAEVCTI